MKVQAAGPWVWIKVLPPEKKRGSLYLPDGNYEEKIGHATGEVISVGSGKLSKKGKRVFSGLEPGDKILFRRYLKILWQPDFENLDRCLIHIDDVAGVLES